jgi:hypothetical protein
MDVGDSHASAASPTSSETDDSNTDETRTARPFKIAGRSGDDTRMPPRNANSPGDAPPKYAGEVIWGRVGKHRRKTWWPGEILAESAATEAVLASRKQGALLIKFFDEKFAWCLSKDICGFQAAYEQHCKQPQRPHRSKVFKESLRVAFGRLPDFRPDGTSPPTHQIPPARNVQRRRDSSGMFRRESRAYRCGRAI